MDVENWGLIALALVALGAAYTRKDQPWRYKLVVPVSLLGFAVITALVRDAGTPWYAILLAVLVVGGVVDGLWISGVWRPGARSLRATGRRRR
ncbi:hypothetical protein [Streptomyces thermolilacinus]|uniref:hypothetical protein n=1 Tax=Streptomyces thermolilacinus TaxID=285540 RepID=UPI0033D11466